MMKKEIKPTKAFYQSFRIYRPDRKCKECGHIIKSKKPNVHFYFLGFLKNDPDMIKVEVTGKKRPWRIHKNFFQKINQP